MRHELPYTPIRIYMGGLILGVNTLYRLFCFFKLFPMVGKGLNYFLIEWNPVYRNSTTVQCNYASTLPVPICLCQRLQFTAKVNAALQTHFLYAMRLCLGTH